MMIFEIRNKDGVTVAVEEDFGNAACFEYKRKTRTNTKPAKDFALDPDHPIGSLPSN